MDPQFLDFARPVLGASAACAVSLVHRRREM